MVEFLGFVILVFSGLTALYAYLMLVAKMFRSEYGFLGGVLFVLLTLWTGGLWCS